LPPLLVEEQRDPKATAGSPTPEEAVTPVTVVSELSSERSRQIETQAAPKSDEARILQMPLDQFEREGCPIQVRVPGLLDTLWFVPGGSERDALVRRAVDRGRIWTAHELMDLSKISSLTREQAQTLARIKVEFDAEVVSIEPLGSPPDPKDGTGA